MELLNRIRARLAATAALQDGFFLPWRRSIGSGDMLWLADGGDLPEDPKAWRTAPAWRGNGNLPCLLLETLAACEAAGIPLGLIRPETIVGIGGCFRLRDPIVADLLAPYRPDWEAYPRVCFLAPELLAGGEWTAAAGRFAAGATIYWLLTGRLPFWDADPRYIAERIRRQLPVDPRYHRPSLHQAVAAGVLALLAKQAEDRPPPETLLPYFRITDSAPPMERLTWCRKRRNPPPDGRPAGNRGPAIWFGAIAALTAIACFLAAGNLHKPAPAPPSLARAEETVRLLYQAKNAGDALRLAALFVPDALPPRPPAANTAVWDRIRRVRLAGGGRRDLVRAVVDLERLTFARGRIARWSGEEVVEMAAVGGRWRVMKISGGPPPAAP